MATPRGSWVPVAHDSDFSIYNIPFGVRRHAASALGQPFIATILGDHVVDVACLARRGLFSEKVAASLQQPVLNDFMSLGHHAWSEVRDRLQSLLADEASEMAVADLRSDDDLRRTALVREADTVAVLPCNIGDYTDFYSSREHATNVGIMFRGAANALQPNWLHLPVGYHGRSSSVVLSGTPFHRPAGQLQVGEEPRSVHGASRQLDFELEMGIFVGTGNALGEPIPIAEAEEHIFGFTLLNDWSARDIQKWEYVPLGPFGAKNFMTTISPWIVTAQALEPFRVPTSAGEQRDPTPLPYLRDPRYDSYDVRLEVWLRASGSAPARIAASNYRHMYWTPRQQLVHHTVTGCNMRPGDLLGSGTISGTDPGSYGSMLELAWRGTKPLALPDGSSRTFLQDGDTLTIRGWCEKDGMRVGFGECTGTVLPAKPLPAEAPASAPAAAAAATASA